MRTGGYPRAPQYRRPTPRTWFPRCFQALPVFIKTQTHTVITSSLHSSVYRAPSNGAEIPPRGPGGTRWGSGLRGRAGRTRSSPGQRTPTSGQLGYAGPPRPPPSMLTVRREKEAGETPTLERYWWRERNEGGRGRVLWDPHHAAIPEREQNMAPPLSSRAEETELAVPTQPETRVWNRPAARRATGAAPGPRTAQDHHPLRYLQAGPGAATTRGAPTAGSLSPRPSPRSLARPPVRPPHRTTRAARALPAGAAAAAECGHPRPRHYKGGGARGAGAGRARPSTAPRAPRAPRRAPPTPARPHEPRGWRVGSCAPARTAPARTAPAQTAPAPTGPRWRQDGDWGRVCREAGPDDTARRSGSAGFP